MVVYCNYQYGDTVSIFYIVLFCTKIDVLRLYYIRRIVEENVLIWQSWKKLIIIRFYKNGRFGDIVRSVYLANAVEK